MTAMMRMGMGGMAVLLAGCVASGTPRYDARFGEAVRQARALQTLNPEAGRSRDPVDGIDGQAGKAAIDRYQDSFRTPPRSDEGSGIGAGIASGGVQR